MKRRFVYILSLLPAILFSGCLKPVNDNPAYPVPQEVMDYFVNFDPGTCWVYQDTLHPGNYDTIELISKKSFCITPDGDIPNNDGYQLYYKPGKMKDFTIFIQPDKNNSCNVNVSPGGFYTTNGLNCGYDNNKWDTGFFKDSILVGKKMYYNALIVNQNYQNYFSDFIFVKDIGLVSYWSEGLPGITYGYYRFVKTFKK